MTKAKKTTSAAAGDAKPKVANGENGKGPEIDPEILKKIATVRAQVRESFGKIAMAMMALPRVGPLLRPSVTRAAVLWGTASPMSERLEGAPPAGIFAPV